MFQILDRAHFLPHIGSGEEARTQYQHLCQALDEYTRKTFSEWTQTVDKVDTITYKSPLYKFYKHTYIHTYIYHMYIGTYKNSTLIITFTGMALVIFRYFLVNRLAKLKF